MRIELDLPYLAGVSEQIKGLMGLSATFRMSEKNALEVYINPSPDEVHPFSIPLNEEQERLFRDANGRSVDAVLLLRILDADGRKIATKCFLSPRILKPKTRRR